MIDINIFMISCIMGICGFGIVFILVFTALFCYNKWTSHKRKREEKDNIYAYGVRYCEDHECVNCFIYKNSIDYRSEYDKCNLHIPCCENIPKYLTEHNLTSLPE